MKKRFDGSVWIVFLIVMAFSWPNNLLGQAHVAMESVQVGFQFEKVPPPAMNDVAAHAEFKILRGRLDPNSIGIEALRNGRLPATEDQPAENFFFAAGTDGGCLEIDLGHVTSVKQFASYSWHASTRAAQVYRLYAASGDESGLTHTLTQGTDPAKNGWSLIASVDSRSQSNLGGQHGVCISHGQNSLGRFRYLLLDIAPTETNDAFGNTFFSEIDIIDADSAVPVPIPIPESSVLTFTASDGKYQFTIDTTKAADLHEWCDRELRPVVQSWYPKIVEMLPSEGFIAPSRVGMRFLDDSQMRGTPAYANGSVITLNTQWFRRELKREARGAVVHEMVHVVQSYSRNRRNPRPPTPGWIVEGIPDYIRWFLYEPESKGAEITQRGLATANYDASYRVTGNFFDYLTQSHDKEIIAKLNAVARNGRYDADFWNETLSKSALELDTEWKNYCRQKIDQAKK